MSQITPFSMKSFVPWCYITNTTPGTHEQFRELLKQWRPSAVLVAIAQLSIAFGYGPENETAAKGDKEAKWIQFLFKPIYVPVVQRHAKAGGIIFFQGQLRYLASEVIRQVPLPSEDLPPPENDDLGELLLRAGELLYQKFPKLEEKYDQIANNVSRFLPIYEIDSPIDPMMQFLRFYIMLTVSIPRMPANLRLFDVPALFEKIMGFPLQTYCEFLTTFAIHALEERSKEIGTVINDCGIRFSVFMHSTVPAELIEQMFKTVSFSLETLAPPKEPIGYADFEALRNEPYLLNNATIYCLDYEFALAKGESGALWRVLNNFETNKEKELYLSFWGNIFEDHVAWIFETYASKKHNAVYPSPKYLNDPTREICDCIIICGTTAILIETKLATCKATTRYSGKYEPMRKFLEDRLVTGGNKPKGVAQLLNVIQNLTSAAPGSLPPWLAAIRKFIPLVITKDEIGSSWSVNCYLNERFNDQIERKKYKGYTITPLVCMSASTLERSIFWMRKIAFSAILEDRMKADKHLEFPFEAKSKYVHKGPTRGVFAHMDTIKKLTDETVKDFGIYDP
jgi:hypothetical protein